MRGAANGNESSSTTSEQDLPSPHFRLDLFQALALAGACHAETCHEIEQGTMIGTEEMIPFPGHKASRHEIERKSRMGTDVVVSEDPILTANNNRTWVAGIVSLYSECAAVRDIHNAAGKSRNITTAYVLIGMIVKCAIATLFVHKVLLILNSVNVRSVLECICSVPKPSTDNKNGGGGAEFYLAHLERFDLVLPP